jgi:hypothetical protein
MPRDRMYFEKPANPEARIFSLMALSKRGHISSHFLRLGLATVEIDILKPFDLNVMEPRGFEPLTSSMPLRRSTN